MPLVQNNIIIHSSQATASQSFPQNFGKNEIQTKSRAGNDIIVPANLVISSFLSSRWSFWMSSSVSSIISSSAISAAVPPIDRTPIDIAAISLTCCSAVIAALLSASFLHGPSRDFITSYNYEFVISIIHLTIWGASLYLIMGVDHELAVDKEGSIWDANLFFSTWLAFSLSVSLVADLATIDDRSGLLPCSYKPNNTIRKGWIYVLVASIVLVMFSLGAAWGGICTYNNRHEDSRCDYIYTTAFLSGMGVLTATFSFILNRYWQTNKLNDGNLARYGAVLAFTSLLSSTANIPVTAANERIGSNSSNLFLLCWVCFLLSLRMCLRYVDVFKSPSTDSSVGHYTGSVTASRRSSFGSLDYEDELESRRPGVSLQLSGDEVVAMSHLGAPSRSIQSIGLFKSDEQSTNILRMQSRVKSPSDVAHTGAPSFHHELNFNRCSSLDSSKKNVTTINIGDRHIIQPMEPRTQKILTESNTPLGQQRNPRSLGNLNKRIINKSSKSSRSSSTSGHRNYQSGMKISDRTLRKSQEWFNRSCQIGEGPPTLSPQVSESSSSYGRRQKSKSSSEVRSKTSPSNLVDLVSSSSSDSVPETRFKHYNATLDCNMDEN